MGSESNESRFYGRVRRDEKSKFYIENEISKLRPFQIHVHLIYILSNIKTLQIDIY